ncbi:hypothetical protein HDU76_003007 [Blyttiomyces sp. JEL0837]|nr:hypothetical protein HDU76_003007 [Blyttiomyces sp. JEL0837]
MPSFNILLKSIVLLATIINASVTVSAQSSSSTLAVTSTDVTLPSVTSTIIDSSLTVSDIQSQSTIAASITSQPVSTIPIPPSATASAPSLTTIIPTGTSGGTPILNVPGLGNLTTVIQNLTPCALGCLQKIPGLIQNFVVAFGYFCSDSTLQQTLSTCATTCTDGGNNIETILIGYCSMLSVVNGGNNNGNGQTTTLPTVRPSAGSGSGAVAVTVGGNGWLLGLVGLVAGLTAML